MLDIQAWKENMSVEAALNCKSAWNCCPVLGQSKKHNILPLPRGKQQPVSRENKVPI
jgi:hypothetical protein